MPAAWSRPLSSSLRYLLPVSKQCSLAHTGSYFAGPHEAMRRQQEPKQLRNFATPAVSYKMCLYSHDIIAKHFSKLQKHFPKALIEDRTDLAKV